MSYRNNLVRLLTLFPTQKTSENLTLKIREFLVESSAIYPSIGEWWDNRVLPGLRIGERTCQVYLVDDEIAALSIIKHAAKSPKLCTLRVRDRYRSLGFGQSLLRLAVKTFMSQKCQAVHYTISEEVMTNCGEFFTPYGFRLASWNKNRYSKGRDELVFSVERAALWERLMKLRANEVNQKALLLSIRPSYADLIERGVKQIEFRRRFSSNWNDTQVYFYVTSPVKEIRLTARVQNIIKSDPTTLWERYHKQGGVDRTTFFNYFEGHREGTALFLNDIQKFSEPVSLKTLRQVDEGFVAPQSHKVIPSDDELYRVMARRVRTEKGG